MKEQALEAALGKLSSVELPGSDFHSVDLCRFRQINRFTGKERPVRRLLRENEMFADESTGLTQTWTKRFDGLRVYKNRIPSLQNDEGSLGFGDIIAPVDEIQEVLLSSYGTDIEWLLSHFKRGTPITLVDQPDGDSAAVSFVPLGNLWPVFQVIHPRFEKGGLFEHGTMHCKLIIIKWKNNRGLRIAISSANLVGFDWEGITQVCWVIDIDSMEPDDSPSTTFGKDLHDFVSTLVGSQALVTDWLSILSEYAPRISAQVPDNIHLVASIPGTFSGENKCKYGQLCIRSILEKNGISQDQCVEFQMSSLGLLQQPFLQSFIESVHAKSGSFHLVWPEYESAMPLPGNDHMMLYEKNASNALKLLTPLHRLKSRESLLNHSKCLVSDDFLYMGSHNMSMSAWGRLVFENKAIQIASYELGILVLKPSSIRIDFPYEPQRRNNQLMTAPPWMFDAFVRKVCSGTEMLSDEERKAITIRCPEPSEVTSLADFLSIKSRNGGNPLFILLRAEEELPTVRDFIESSWLSRNDIDLFQVFTSCDYGKHLAAFFQFKEFPALVVLEGGSELGRHCEIVQKLQSAGNILSKNVEEVISLARGHTSFREDPVEEILLEAGIKIEPSVPSSSSALSFISERGISLLCLDVDGTIVDSNTSSAIIPSVADFLSKLDGKTVKIALVTNQGAVGLKHWMTSNSFGDPSSLPTQEEVEQRLHVIVEKIKTLFHGEIKVFMAFRYQSKGNNGKQQRWGPVPFTAKDDPRWQQDWRKPSPGMITAAMKWAGISIFNKSKILMVGDMDTDEGAARAAGVAFRRAPDFFTYNR